MPRKELDEWILQIGGDLHWLSSELSAASPKIARQKEWAPRVDVIEVEEWVNVKVELAGVRVGQVTIQFNGERNCLVIRGVRNDETCDQGKPVAPHLLEIEYGEFAREVPLPDIALEISNTQAFLHNGMLTIRVPKVSDGQRPGIVVEHRLTVRRLK